MNGQPRCPIRGCFTVYRGGPDRLCPIHQEEQATYDIGQRMTDLSLETAPEFAIDGDAWMDEHPPTPAEGDR